jgi:hypothetical protein
MSAIYNFGLVAYPLYQTSKHFNTEIVADEERKRLLNFWVTFGTLKVAESFGANHIPLFYIAEILVLLSLYTEHSAIVANFLPRLGLIYIKAVDKACKAWNESSTVQNTVSTVTTASWYQSGLSSINAMWTYTISFLPGAASPTEPKKKVD